MGRFILSHSHYAIHTGKEGDISNSALRLQTPYTTFMNALYDPIQTDTPPVPLIKANLSWLYSNDFLQQPGILDNPIQIIIQNPYPFTLAGFRQSLAAAAFDSSRGKTDFDANIDYRQPR